MPRRCYQVLDVGLCLESPDESIAARFHDDYQRFSVPALAAAPQLEVRLEASSDGTPSAMDLGWGRLPLGECGDPSLQATQAIAQALMDRVRTYTVLHAAALGREEGVLAIAGPPGSGKTTLTLALLEAGWSFLSDDFCPVHHGSGLVHPFPRSLWVRPRPGASASNAREGKLRFPLEAPSFRIETEPRPLRWLICLQEEGSADETQRFRVTFRKGMEQPCLDELGALDGSSIQGPPGSGSQAWVVSYPKAARQTAEVRELLFRHREAVVSAFALQIGEPDFSGSPSLSPLSPMAAAFCLLRELKHAPGGAVEQRPGALLAHLGALLGEVACFRLTPGTLAQRLALIQTATARQVGA